jgi:hypothetical protein
MDSNSMYYVRNDLYLVSGNLHSNILPNDGKVRVVSYCCTVLNNNNSFYKINFTWIMAYESKFLYWSRMPATVG